jgi:hypothetical protein
LANNPKGATFYIDDIQYNLGPTAQKARLNSPHFIQSYVTLPYQLGSSVENAIGNFDYYLRNCAFTYDNAVAILAFLADGSKDSLRRAQIIGDAFLFAAAHDRSYTNGQVRSAYAAGNISVPPGWFVNGMTNTISVPGFFNYATQSFDEVNTQDIDVGDNAWTMIALLALYQKTNVSEYLNEALAIGNYLGQFRSTNGLYPGFLGGITDAESTNSTPRSYASTEHNLDIHAAFTQAYIITGNPSWSEGAAFAESFAESMWSESNGCYLAGTTGPASVNTSVFPLDVNSWNILSRTNVLSLHPQLLSNIIYLFACTNDGFSGFGFNTNKDGVWFEGTGQMCVADAFSGEPSLADSLAQTLIHAQQMPRPIGDGWGLVSASHDQLPTGFNNDYDANYYNRRMHIGATSWMIFTLLYYNPYYQTVAIFK